MDYKKPQSTLVHGGAGIYPLTTADQVILADGSRLEKDGRISADSAANSAKLGGKAPEYYIQPRNLLDNSDFRNPVNQRGITNVSAIGYCIDRWIFGLSGSGALNVQDGLLAFNASNESYCEIVQIQENSSALSGKEMTFVVCIAPDNIICLNFTYGTNASVLSADGNISLIHHDGDRVYIRIFSTGNNWIGVKWAALYEGSYTAETLPPYVPKGYAAELAECRRYFERIGKSYSGSGNASMLMAVGTSGEMRVLQGYTVPKRIMSPTIKLNGKVVGETVSVRNSMTNDFCTGVLSVWNNSCADRLNTLTVAGTSVVGAVYEGYLDIIADL